MDERSRLVRLEYPERDPPEEAIRTNICNMYIQGKCLDGNESCNLKRCLRSLVYPFMSQTTQLVLINLPPSLLLLIASRNRSAFRPYCRLERVARGQNAQFASCASSPPGTLSYCVRYHSSSPNSATHIRSARASPTRSLRSRRRLGKRGAVPNLNSRRMLTFELLGFVLRLSSL